MSLDRVFFLVPWRFMDAFLIDLARCGCTADHSQGEQDGKHNLVHVQGTGENLLNLEKLLQIGNVLHRIQVAQFPDCSRFVDYSLILRHAWEN